MRGRKPLPPTLRLLSGNQGKRGISKELREQVKATLAAGGKITATIGPAPESLSPAAVAIWDRVIAEAVWLDASNRELLTAYCIASDRMITQPRNFRSNALLVRSLAAEMGLSATARARLNSQPREPQRASDLPPELSGGTAKSQGA